MDPLSSVILNHHHASEPSKSSDKSLELSPPALESSALPFTNKVTLISTKKTNAIQTISKQISSSSSTTSSSAIQKDDQIPHHLRKQYDLLNPIFQLINIDLYKDFGCFTLDQILNLSLPVILLYILKNKNSAIDESQFLEKIAGTVNHFAIWNTGAHSFTSSQQIHQQNQVLYDLFNELAKFSLNSTQRKLIPAHLKAIEELRMEQHSEEFYSQPLAATEDLSERASQATFIKYTQFVASISNGLIKICTSIHKKYETTRQQYEKLNQEWQTFLSRNTLKKETLNTKYQYVLFRAHVLLRVINCFDDQFKIGLTKTTKDFNQTASYFPSPFAFSTLLEQMIKGVKTTIKRSEILSISTERSLNEIEFLDNQDEYARLPEVIHRGKEASKLFYQKLSKIFLQWLQKLPVELQQSSLNHADQESLIQYIANSLLNDSSIKNLDLSQLELIDSHLSSLTSMVDEACREISLWLIEQKKKYFSKRNIGTEWFNLNEASNEMLKDVRKWIGSTLKRALKVSPLKDPAEPSSISLKKCVLQFAKLSKETIELIGKESEEPQTPREVREILLKKESKSSSKGLLEKFQIGLEVAKSHSAQIKADFNNMQSAMQLIEFLMGPAEDLRRLFLDDSRLLIDLPIFESDDTDSIEVPTSPKKQEGKKRTSFSSSSSSSTTSSMIKETEQMPLPVLSSAASVNTKPEGKRNSSSMVKEAEQELAGEEMVALSSSSPSVAKASLIEETFNKLLVETATHFNMKPYASTLTSTLNKGLSNIKAARYDQLQAMYHVQVMTEMLRDSRCFINQAFLPCIMRTFIPTLRHYQYLAIERNATAKIVEADPEAILYHDLIYLTNASTHPIIKELRRETLEIRYPTQFKIKNINSKDINLLNLDFIEFMGQSLPVNKEREQTLKGLRKEAVSSRLVLHSIKPPIISGFEIEKERLKEIKKELQGLCQKLQKFVEELSERDKRTPVLRKTLKHLTSLHDATELMELFPEQRYLFVSMAPMILAAQHVFESLGRYLLVVNKGMTEESIFEQLRNKIHDLRYLSDQVDLNGPLNAQQRLGLLEFNVFKGSEYLNEYLSRHSEGTASSPLLLIAKLIDWSKAHEGFAPSWHQSDSSVKDPLADLRKRMVNHLQTATELSHVLINSHVFG